MQIFWHDSYILGCEPVKIWRYNYEKNDDSGDQRHLCG